MGPTVYDPKKHAVILFDGVCNVCNHSVQFIINHDKNSYFLFASLQSPVAESYFSTLGISDKNLRSIVLIEGEQYVTESTAVLRICKRLTGLWKILYVLILVPPFIRDPAYRLFARNRYRFFGKREQCMIPSPEIKTRFLD
ncbi:thiol-disulfide oxidoreductase [Shouchella clausii]|uniref:thiol-disulfide oxidoreductase DCC family protein n=1 Tax=Shouchella clausii TaxID=79880 RepID=UPI000BA7A4D0|nr:DCC1-like thiol-disulfide oxidoreductase family protein [Shouchella clausii]PAD45979.1 thiol-disulfide oxidoreductase [Shouchella clausii]GIN18037.1 thiol-disulfide oxidoreductase [Shouchella clausii]